MKLHTYFTHSLPRYGLMALGCICTILAVIGIFLPLLPTTVFVLIAAWCFTRSSDRLHQWLINHPRLGPVLDCWHTNAGISPSLRNRALTMLWISLFVSMFIVAKLWAVALLGVIGCAVSAYLLRLPLIEKLPQPENNTATPTQIPSNKE
ncbi:MAG: YbaN family protein [Spongiibacteraceae bacterium]|nr:YbaN family protein [Spongiibacteraceae bacterium]